MIELIETARVEDAAGINLPGSSIDADEDGSGNECSVDLVFGVSESADGLNAGTDGELVDVAARVLGDVGGSGGDAATVLEDPLVRVLHQTAVAAITHAGFEFVVREIDELVAVGDGGDGLDLGNSDEERAVAALALRGRVANDTLVAPVDELGEIAELVVGGGSAGDGHDGGDDDGDEEGDDGKVVEGREDGRHDVFFFFRIFFYAYECNTFFPILLRMILHIFFLLFSI